MRKQLLQLFLFCTYISSGQNLGGMQRDISEFNSPQVASMLRFDESSVDLNTGKFNLEIPLIDFPDRDFKFPISLRYNSAGFRPNEPENFVGLNWSLQPVCAIYREVKGIPDDHPFCQKGEQKDMWSDYEEFCGFLAVRDRNITICKEDILNKPDQFAPLGKSGFPRIKDAKVDGVNIEASSDIYRFSVDSYSGFFMIDYDGSVRAISTSGGVVKVDISQYQMMSKFGSQTNKSKIIIKGDNGYTYIFGGSYSAMEYHAVTWDFSCAPSSPSNPKLPPHPTETPLHIQLPVVSAFFLSEMIAPNGRTMTIEYDTTVDDKYSTYHNTPYELLWNLSYLVNESYPHYEAPQKLRKCYQIKTEYYACSRNLPQVLFESGGGIFGKTSKDLKNISVKKTAIIKRIETDNKTVEFYYSPRRQSMYAGDLDLQLAGLTTPTDKLDKITIAIAGTQRQVTELSYYENGNLFLTQVNNSKIGKYQFEYVDMHNQAISPLTINVDHWKFWRGDTFSEATIPQIRILYKIDERWQTDHKILTNEKEPASTGFDRNMLSIVKFPTGGKAKYTYELHDYSVILQKDHNTNYRPVCTSPERLIMNAGGTRIRNIKYYEKEQLLKQTNYIYKGHLSTNSSSGILLHSPRYVVPLRFLESPLNNNKKYTYLAIWNSNGYDNMSYDSDHVKYSYVMEINAIVDQTLPVSEWTKINGYKATKFSDVYDHCDLNWMANSYYDRVYECQYWKSIHESSSWPEWLLRLGDIEFYTKSFRDFGDTSIERGKIENESYFSAAGRLIKKIDYAYTKYPQTRVPPNESLPYMIYTTTPLPIYLALLGRWTQINRKLFYQYHLTKKTETNYSDSIPANILIEEYKYSQNGGYLKEHTTRNSDGSVYKTEYQYINDTESWSDNHPKNSHTMFSLPTQTSYYRDNVCLYSIKNQYKTISAPPGQSIANITLSPATTKIRSRSYVLADDEYQITDYVKYNRYGNPVYIVKDRVSNTVYLWGYRGHHVIATIENATDEQVTNALGGISPAAVTFNDPSLIKRLRNSPILKDALVTTYKYRDLIGVTEVTDPSGRVTTYEYDEAGRLTKVLDDKGNPLNEYQYNYVNQ